MLKIWGPDDLANGIAASVTLAIETAAASGQINRDFLRGILALAKAQALQYGIAWPALVAEVRAAIGEERELLLDLVTVERPRLGP